MKTIAYHLSGQLYGCNYKDLNNLGYMVDLAKKAAKKGHLKYVKHIAYKHKLPNGKHQGVSICVIVEESHLSLFSWPEHGYLLCDILTCGKERSVRRVLHYIAGEMCPSKMEVKNETTII